MYKKKCHYILCKSFLAIVIVRDYIIFQGGNFEDCSVWESKSSDKPSFPPIIYLNIQKLASSHNFLFFFFFSMANQCKVFDLDFRIEMRSAFSPIDELPPFALHAEWESVSENTGHDRGWWFLCEMRGEVKSRVVFSEIAWF